MSDDDSDNDSDTTLTPIVPVTAEKHSRKPRTSVIWQHMTLK